MASPKGVVKIQSVDVRRVWPPSSHRPFNRAQNTQHRAQFLSQRFRQEIRKMSVEVKQYCLVLDASLKVEKMP